MIFGCIVCLVKLYKNEIKFLDTIFTTSITIPSLSTAVQKFMFIWAGWGDDSIRNYNFLLPDPVKDAGYNRKKIMF